MHDRTPEPPFPDACRTGRMLIPPCCTASVRGFLAGSTLYLASHVIGHGWSPAWSGRIEDINDDGTMVEAAGRGRRIRWRAEREGR
jgi:hypothetical protein